MKILSAVLFLAAALTLLYLPAGADDEEGVEILVTPKLIAISVDQDQLDYGAPEVASVDNRPSPDKFKVTNASTVAVDLQIFGAGTEGVISGDPGWALSSTAGVDAYVHMYSFATTPVYPNDFSKLLSAPEDIPGLAIGAFVNIKLALDMPTSTSTLEQQTAPVTVIALDAGP